MKNCLQCNQPLTHVEGRKQKSFCNVNCRNKYFYAKRSQLIKEAQAKIVENNKPKEKRRIEKERNTPHDLGNKIQQPVSVEECVPEGKHPLWQEGDPKEKSMAFFLKYDCYSYEELENKLKNGLQ